MFNVNNQHTPERCHWGLSGVFIVNFDQTSHIVLMFPLLLWTSADWVQDAGIKKNLRYKDGCFQIPDGWSDSVVIDWF